MSLKLDHILIYAENLSEAIDEFKKRGFTAVERGTHEGGISENAIIPFADGTFIELISFTPGVKSTFVRLLHRFGLSGVLRFHPKYHIIRRIYGRMSCCRDGMFDFCMVSDDFNRDMARMTHEGLRLSSPVSASRITPEDEQVKWQMCVPDQEYLPFFRSEYTGESHSSAWPSTHQCGVTGIRKIIVMTDDLKTVGEAYQAFSGVEPQVVKSEKHTVLTFPVGQRSIDVVSPPDEKIRKHGWGMYAVEFTEDPS